ncbi:MAG: HAMP domain-containing histidine kinase [Desulfobacteraceae bacterium]|nr:HAMP domain-containing histidine kinase [Desulfobacteraceae bacterium]MBC2758049.1 HAMP domain-containing histidine kinase [Desulfobacteraceae bacterium]
MIEHLLSMEENNKKYQLLKKKEYWNYYISAKQEFEDNLSKILDLENTGIVSLKQWKILYKSYSIFDNGSGHSQHSETTPKSWIPETFLNQWLQIISSAQAENEQNIAMSLVEINHRGQLAARNGLIGLGVSILAGLFGSLFLANSMIRPIRKIRRGIRSISKDQFSDAIQIHSKDEFGELAGAFNEMAKRLNEEELMRSDFISMLSHEIRTPLTSIRESVNMIEEEVMGPVNQQQRKFLKIAGSEIDRISNLLNHLMHVSKMESDTLEIHPIPIAAEALISKSITQLEPLAQAKNIDFKIQIPPDIPKIKGAPDHLHQVFINIIGNAIKFSKPGENIGVYVSSDNNQKGLIFSISDSGPGIPKEELPLIFTKYYRSREVRDHMDGVGLGLNISKQIIIAHGGQIWVKSVKGKGSIFEFTLPAAKSYKKIIDLKRLKQP